MQITLTAADRDLRNLALRARDESVTLVEGGQEIAIVLSPAEYRRLQIDNAKALHQIATFASAHAEAAGLTDEKLAELLSDAA